MERGFFKQVCTQEADFHDKKGRAGRCFSCTRAQCTFQVLSYCCSSAQDQTKITFSLSFNQAQQTSPAFLRVVRLFFCSSPGLTNPEIWVVHLEGWSTFSWSKMAGDSSDRGSKLPHQGKLNFCFLGPDFFCHVWTSVVCLPYGSVHGSGLLQTQHHSQVFQAFGWNQTLVLKSECQEILRVTWAPTWSEWVTAEICNVRVFMEPWGWQEAHTDNGQ